MLPPKLAFLVLVLVTLTSARTRRSRSDESQNFIGAATNQLSKAILQSYVDDESNLAFSPFGFSAILAILAEGARGETLAQLRTALKLPQDSDKVRQGYQSILKRFYNTNEYKLNVPEFKNWFYVYKNYTINDDYKAILEKYYLTDVKSVMKYDSSFFSKDKETVENADPLPEIEIKDPVPKLKDNSKDVQNFEQIRNSNNEEEAKKSQETVKKSEEEKIISFAMEDKPQVVVEEFKQSNKENIKKNPDEIMDVAETINHPRTAKNLDKSAAQGLSANRVGNKESTSLMILFNGLYFRGTWKTPFVRAENAAFYIKPTEKKSVPVMKTKGTFKAGSLPGLSSTAIELPYEDDRYTLTIIKPKERDGLKKLCEDLTNFALYDVSDMLVPTKSVVTMPLFYVETTTKPMAALAEFGVGSIFNPKADLSGISPMGGLFVQEMVQHVSIKVDESETNGAQLSAANPSIPLERSQPLFESGETISIDHPFLYFVKDVKDNVVVAAGKVYNPMQEESF